MPKNPKRDPLGSLKVFFYKPTTSKKFKGVRFDRIEKFSKKSCRVPKKPKGGPFGLPFIFGNIKTCGLVQDSNPESLKISWRRS